MQQVRPVHLVLVHLLNLQAFPITLTLRLKVQAQAILTQIVKLMHNRVAHRKVNLTELQAHQLVVVGLIAKVKVLVGAYCIRRLESVEDIST